MAVDTLKLYERFRKASLQDEAAKEIAEAFKEANDELLDRLATKKDLELTELTLRKEIAEAKTSTIIWVAGMMLAQTAAIIGIFLKFLPK